MNDSFWKKRVELEELLRDILENHYDDFIDELRIDVLDDPKFDDTMRYWEVHGVVVALDQMGVRYDMLDGIKQDLLDRAGYRRGVEETETHSR